MRAPPVPMLQASGAPARVTDGDVPERPGAEEAVVRRRGPDAMLEPWLIEELKRQRQRQIGPRPWLDLPMPEPAAPDSEPGHAGREEPEPPAWRRGRREANVVLGPPQHDA